VGQQPLLFSRTWRVPMPDLTLRQIEARWKELGCPDMAVKRSGDVIMVEVCQPQEKGKVKGE